VGHVGHNPDVTTVFTGPKSQPLLAEGLVLFGFGRLLSYPTGGSPNLFRAGPNRLVSPNLGWASPFGHRLASRCWLCSSRWLLRDSQQRGYMDHHNTRQSQLSLYRTPTPSCEGVGFFGSGGAARSPRPTDCPVYFRL